jgi:isoleucyl-tRNA synthetase
VLHRIVEDLTRLMAPVLPFTADEVFGLIPGERGESVHLALFPAAERPDQALLDRWQALLDVRASVTKVLEEARAAKTIASSLEAQVVVQAPAAKLAPLRSHEEKSPGFPGNLANLFIVSKALLREGNGELSVAVDRAPGAKCERCWTYSEKVGREAVHDGVCERCAAVLESRERP